MRYFIIFTVLIPLPVAAVVQDDEHLTINLDPVTGNYIIRYDDDGVRQEVIYEPPTKVSPSAQAQVDHDPDTASYTYRYKITNQIESAQLLFSFMISYGTPIENAVAPKGWDSASFHFMPVWDWAATMVEPRGIERGGSREGFSFQSKGLPGVAQAYFRGYTKIIAFPEEEPLSFEEKFKPIGDFPNNTVQRKTVGPVAPPANFVPLEFLTYLIDLKHQAQTLGWIGGPKLVLELDKKLDEVKGKLFASEIESAVGKLTSFIEKVEAHYKETKEHEIEKIKEPEKKEGKEPEEKKFITSEGYALLKFNAEYLKDQLSKSKEPEEDKHEDKKEEPKR